MKEILIGVSQEIVATFIDMAPYLLLGLTFAGILHILFKKDFVLRHLGGGPLSSSIKAALLGVPLPLCSCGVLPTALSLRRNHASESATMSFLISTPQTGIDSIIATYGMLGPVFAIFRPVAAFVMGVVGGVVTGIVGKPASEAGAADKMKFHCVVCEDSGPHDHSIREKLKSMITYAYGDFLDDISRNLVIGIVISGVISFFLPEEFFTRYVGNQWLEMLIMIAGGVPLYVCATASIPIAAVLMMKGLSPGAAFVFLAVGPATNAASIMLIGNTIGKRFVAIYITVISLCSIAAGTVLNLLFGAQGLEQAMKHIHEHDPEGFSWGVFFSIVFFVMLLISLYRTYLAPHLAFATHSLPPSPAYGNADGEMDAVMVIGIDGMTCNHCAANVKEAISAIPGVESVSVDLAGKKTSVKGTIDVSAVRGAVKEAGYDIIE